MHLQLISDTQIPILELTGAVSSIDDALEIISACYAADANKILLRSEQLPADFYELQTRFAGEFIQKLVNYRLSIACVFKNEQMYSQRFREYIGEAKNGRQFRSFSNDAEALRWLEAQA